MITIPVDPEALVAAIVGVICFFVGVAYGRYQAWAIRTRREGA